MSLIPTQAPTADATYAKNTVPVTILTTQATIMASLWISGDNTPLISVSYVPDFSGRVYVDFSDIYNDVLKTELPDGTANVVQQYYSKIKFVIKLSDSNSNDAEISFWVCNAMLKSSTAFEEWSLQNFLTNQPIEKYTNYEAPEWLTYIDRTDRGYNVLKVRFYKKIGGHIDNVVRIGDADGIFSVNVSYKRLIQMANVLPNSLLGYYDVILFTTGSTEVCRQRYIFEERTGCEKYFLFINQLGGIDTLLCQGENVLQPEVTHNIGRFGNLYTALDDTDDHRVWEQNTGSLPNKYRNWLHELFTTKQGAAIYDADGETYTEIVLTASDLSVGDFGQLASASFSYMLNETVNVISDTERAVDRSLRQSVADEAEELEDLTRSAVLPFADNGQGGYETEDLEIETNKVFVSFIRPSEATNIDYYIDGKKIGTFGAHSVDIPFLINHGVKSSIQFTTASNNVESLVVTYYPINLQSV